MGQTDGLCRNSSALLQMMNRRVDVPARVYTQDRAVGRPLPPSAAPWFGGLSRPLADPVPGKCLWDSSAGIRGRREAQPKPEAHPCLTGRHRSQRGARSADLGGSITAGQDLPLAEAGAARHRGSCLSRAARAGGLRAGRVWLTACLAPQQRSPCSSRPLRLRARSCPRIPRVGRQACPSPCPLAR